MSRALMRFISSIEKSTGLSAPQPIRFLKVRQQSAPGKGGPASRARARPLANGALALQTHGNAHAATNAERGETLLGVAPLHLEKQRHENARAGGADRVTDGDRATIDVDLGGVPAEVLVDGA